MKIHVLIVETNDEIRLNLVQRLSLDQYAVFETNNPKKVKAIIRQRKIDVVLLGLIGLSENGLSVLKTIKRLRYSTEVIIINNAANISLSIAGMKLGAFQDLYMPFDINTLIKTIDEAYIQKTETEKEKTSLLQKYEAVMSALTFAEMGEADTALSFLTRSDQPSSGQQRLRTKKNEEDQNGSD